MFVFDDLDVFTDAWTRPDGPYAYSRFSNPTTRALEEAVADLEGGVGALATASGMGAISAVLLSLLRTGDHVIVQRGVYGGTTALLRDLAERWGVAISYIATEHPDAVCDAVRPNTKLLYLETITNPMGQVCDLPAFAVAAREAGLLTIVDNTFATPLLCQPVRHGADIVVHSTTKYIAGHSDVVGGIAVFADHECHRTVWGHATELGVSCDPFAAWLTLRGLQTLPVRMRRHCDSVEVLARRLVEHPKVVAVHWAGFAGNPSHECAAKLLSGFGGLFAFDIAGGRPAGRSFTNRIRLASLAPSLGGVSTTVLHPASTSHSQLTDEELRAANIGEGTIRVAVGLEHVDDLWNDFSQALG